MGRGSVGRTDWSELLKQRQQLRPQPGISRRSWGTPKEKNCSSCRDQRQGRHDDWGYRCGKPDITAAPGSSR